uniref:hypothetical protein n=1 Tax=Clostridium sp. NkU-1 TaxID=1095009 RepID=UPI000AFEB03C
MKRASFFQAWGKLEDEKNYRMIIDCLLNMPLLFWAGEVTGEENFIKKGRSAY